jgi:hypothetical protein
VAGWRIVSTMLRPGTQAISKFGVATLRKPILALVSPLSMNIDRYFGTFKLEEMLTD